MKIIEEVVEEVVKSEEVLKQEAYESKKETLVKEEVRLTEDDEVVEVVEQVMKDDLLAKYDQWDIDDDAEIARRTDHKVETERLRGLLVIKK